jgi:hypothetical protein
MGFLSNLFGDLADPDAVHQPIIDLVCLSIASDGVITEQEIAQAHTFAVDMMGVQEPRVAALVDHTFERIERDGFHKTLETAAAQLHLDQHREAAFLAAAWVQHADGHVARQEEDFLALLARALHLEVALCDEMLAYVEAQTKADTLIVDA